jgi:hypothetical protein
MPGLAFQITTRLMTGSSARAGNATSVALKAIHDRQWNMAASFFAYQIEQTGNARILFPPPGGVNPRALAPPRQRPAKAAPCRRPMINSGQ